MAGARTIVSRSNGRALVVAAVSNRAGLVSTLQELNFVCAEVDDPYVALAELCRRPLAYRAVVLSLAGFYREELALVRTVKQRFPHVDVWLTHSDGRHASLAEAMRLGADGLLADDGLHRTAVREQDGAERPGAARPTNGHHHVPPSADTPHATSNGHGTHPTPSTGEPAPHVERSKPDADDQPDSDFVFGEPVLTADELRALLQEQPISSDDEH